MTTFKEFNQAHSKISELSIQRALQYKLPIGNLLKPINPFPIRTVIHLSDLHIGMNNSPIPLDQAQKVIDGIKSAYFLEDPKPIVIITGDLVDYYSEEYLNNALDLLQQLEAANFTVLVIPGNHDYSEAIDLHHGVSPLQIPHPELLSSFIGGLITGLLDSEADGEGYDQTLASGFTYNSNACTDFRSIFGKYMYNGFYHESWRDKGAVFDLDFILLDGQDHHTRGASLSNSDLTAPLMIYPKFYFHDNTRHGDSVSAGNMPDHVKSGLRFDLGWLEDCPKKDGLGSAEVGVSFFNNMVQKSMNNQSIRIVAIHYPLSIDQTRDFKPWEHSGNQNGHYLVNEADLFNNLNNCDALLVGHTHCRPKNSNNDKDYSYNGDPSCNCFAQVGLNASTNIKQYYCIAGATFPDNKNGYWGDINTDTDAKKACRTWVELNIDLNSRIISANARGCDGSNQEL